MKRVIFLNRFFYPDHSATSQIVSDLAFHLAASGMDVRVITNGQLYDSPRAFLAAQEIVNGVHIPHANLAFRTLRDSRVERSIMPPTMA
jgi:hypothetical protein